MQNLLVSPNELLKENELTFDQATHTYFLNKKPISSVTQICAPRLPELSNIKAAAILGSQIHKSMQDYHEKGKCFHEHTPLIKKAFATLYSTFPKEKFCYEFEKMGFCHKNLANKCPQLGCEKCFDMFPNKEDCICNAFFAGTCDLLVRKKSDNTVYALVDFKTSISRPWHATQLAGYQMIFGKSYTMLFNLYLNLPTKACSLNRVHNASFYEAYYAFKIHEHGLLSTPDLKKYYNNNELEQISDCANQYKKVAALKEELKNEEVVLEQYKKLIIDAMEEKDLPRLSHENISFTAIAPTTAYKFNCDKFKEAKPELYDKFLCETPVKGYLKMTIGKKNYLL